MSEPDPASGEHDPPPEAAPAGGEQSTGGEPESPPLRGPELARAVLDAARVRRQQTGTGGGRRRTTGAAGGRTARRTWSGPGPDPRDPQPFGAALAKLLKDRGWQRPAAEATVFGRWEEVVGAELAQHCRPVKLEGGELTIEAESTAWATQLRLLAGSMLKQISAKVGHNVVTRLRIHGPAAPSWYRGPRRVRGRGPRDTYG